MLRERFDASDHGLVGTSISVHDGRTGRWVQTWMDSDGSWFHLSGAMHDGSMELVTALADADGYTKRMRFSEIEPASFRWTWARSRGGGGGGWEPLWEIGYRRTA